MGFRRNGAPQIAESHDTQGQARGLANGPIQQAELPGLAPLAPAHLLQIPGLCCQQVQQQGDDVLSYNFV